MKRRTFVRSFALAALAEGSLRASASARRAGPARIGVLAAGASTSPPGADPLFAAYLDAMAGLGYPEGRAVVHEWRFAEGRFEALPALANELVAGRPDVIVARTTPGALTHAPSKAAIPIVFVGVADPVGAGLVASLSRPGANVTGITNNVADLAGKRLALLKEALPGIRRVAVLANTDDPNAPLQLASVERAAASLGLALGPVLTVRRPEDFDEAFGRATAAGAQAAIRFVDPSSATTRVASAQATLRHRLAVVYAFREDAEAGGLIAYGTDLGDQFRQAAAMVDRILRGAKPAGLPVLQPRKLELVVNLRTAEHLGLKVPAALVQRADHVIR